MRAMRPLGYYWIKDRGFWEVGMWANGWFMCDSTDRMQDADLEAIGPKIEPPRVAGHAGEGSKRKSRRRTDPRDYRPGEAARWFALLPAFLAVMAVATRAFIAVPIIFASIALGVWWSLSPRDGD